MKKLVLLVFVMLLLTCMGWSKPITLDQAKQVAINIMVERSSFTNPTIVTNIVDKNQAGQPLIYIFNFRPASFVMISAEDNVLPVLGYSFDQIYSNDNHPIQFDDLLTSYRGQIQYALTNNLPSTSTITNEWLRLNVSTNNFVPINSHDRNVAPILQTNWGQGTYYNYYCPSGTPVGCVAVAMGQIMKHWSYPSMGTGSHSYTCNPYGTLSANFGTTSYSWSLMPAALTSNNTYLATLLYHLGVSVNMGYAPGGSGAYDEDAKAALTNYFGYKNTSTYILKNGYPGGDTAWDLKMKSEIDAGRPVYYSGYGPAGGHAFDLDGYNGSAYPYQFHFNWGWDSYYNGYFLLSSLNPGGDTFNSNCAAIVGIEPGAALSSNLSESFDTATTIPVGWAVNPSATWAIESTYYQSTPYGAYYQATATGSAYSGKRLITPKLTVSAGNTISFYARNGTSARGEVVKVKWTTDLLTYSDFTTAQATPVLGASFTQYTFNIGTYKTGDYYVAFETYSATSTNNQKLIVLDTVVGPPLYINPLPVVSLNTNAWAAGNVSPGAQGISGDNFAITNTGGGSLTITSATISGAGAAKFSTNFNIGTVLQHSGVYPFGFTYEPTAYASDSAVFTIVTNGGTVTINLTGSCVYNVFQDGFETYSDFAISFPPWTMIDVDGGSTWGVSGYSWLNVGVPQSFIIFDPLATTPAMTTTAGSTHSGAKMAAAWNTVTASAPNNDWLITPLLTLTGASTVNFWAKAFSSGYPAEKFSVMYSTTGNAAANFTGTIQATVTMTTTQNAWTFYTWNVSSAVAATIKYVGIHVTSNDQFAFMLDDFYIHDASTAPAFPSMGNIEGHVYAYGTTNPITNATVAIGAKSTTTDLNGYYRINNLVVGSYTMNCSAPGTSYFSTTQTGVAITSGVTATLNLGLKWSTIVVTPPSLTQTLNPFATTDQTLTVTNPTGTADLEYGIFMQTNARGSNNKLTLGSVGDKQKILREKPVADNVIKNPNDRVTGWMDFSAGYAQDGYWGGTGGPELYPERCVYYSLDALGLFSNLPITVSKLRHAFYQDSNNVWGTSNTFKFRIYAADMVTVLFTSPTLTAASSYTTGATTGFVDVTTYTLPTPMTFSTDFIVGIIPTSTTTGYPASSCSNVEGWSLLSDTSPATSSSWWTTGWEFNQGIYVENYDMWAGFSSYSGTVAPGSSQTITCHFNSTNLNGASRNAIAYFSNNAIYHTPRGDNMAVPLSLTVNTVTTPIPVLNTSNWSTICASTTTSSSGNVFTLSNMGIGTLTVSSITNLSATDFSTTFVPTGIALTNGQSYSFGFTYHPTSPGVDNISFNIITSNGTVTVTLTGYGDYNLEGFEGTNFPPDGWANIDQDGDTFKWFAYSVTGAPEIPYEGLLCAGSESYQNDAKSTGMNHTGSRLVLTPDNYLVTPKLAINSGDVLKYWVGAQYPGAPAEHYSVKISETTPNAAGLTTELFAETMTDALWHERTIDLSAYAHHDIYIAFEHHACTDQFILKLDNVLYPNLAAPLQYGSLKGNVFASGTTNPIQNATVTINNLSAVTDVDGYYEIPNILVGTYDATCVKPVGSYYFDQTITGVVINADEPTSQDFGLTWAELGVSPTSFDVTVAAGGTADRNLTISNPAGTANLQYVVRLWDTSARAESPVMASSKSIPDRSLTASLPADVQKIQNTHQRTPGWYGYASTDDYNEYTWAGTERATKYVLQDLGLLKPVTITKLTTFFYNPTTTPWVDATYHFVIYAADGTTVLYTSADLEATSLAEVDYTLTTPLVVDGDFYVSVVPTDISSSPFTLATNLYSGNSYYKVAGVWTLSTDEYLNFVYAEGAGWLTVTNGSGSVVPTGSATVGLHFDAAGLENTSRSCTIAIFNNSNNTTARGVTRQIPVLFTITGGGTLTAPTNVSVSYVSGNPVITWAAVSGATSYKVYGSDDPYASNWGTAIASPTTPSFTIVGGPQWHFYKITAVSGAKSNSEVPVGKPVSTKK